MPRGGSAFGVSDHRRGSSSSFRGSNMRGNWGGRQKKTSAPKAEPPPLGPVLSIIRLIDLDEAVNPGDETSKITNVVDIASFNWLNTTIPTIQVPGMLLYLPLRPVLIDRDKKVCLLLGHLLQDQ